MSISFDTQLRNYFLPKLISAKYIRKINCIVLKYVYHCTQSLKIITQWLITLKIVYMLKNLMTLFNFRIHICNANQHVIVHYSDVIMSVMASQITGISLFAQPYVQVQIKENIKALHHWPLWEASTSAWWIPLTKGQLCGNIFHLTMPSCLTYLHIPTHFFLDIQWPNLLSNKDFLLYVLMSLLWWLLMWSPKNSKSKTTLTVQSYPKILGILEWLYFTNFNSPTL